MQPLLRGLDPGFEPISLPAARSDEHGPGRLDEEDAKVSVSPPGDRPENGSVPGGHLFGHESEPGGEVAPLGEGVAATDRCYHGAGDDRSDTWDAHQPLATG